MSLYLDLDAIRTHFVDSWDFDTIQTVMANGEALDLKEDEPAVRFSINPGTRRLIGGDRLYQQLGRVWLQIFVPKQQGAMMGFDLADKFTGLYRHWQSEDGCVRIEGEHVEQIPNGENGYFQVNVSVEWRSVRRL
ncbi:hypothetical protein [Brevundimonas sp. NPDC058933]|uniref:hypothetical protein n=1 Tax=Brevundimonas sp. NPDC058933 TaxID=3346673 RepID=UPI003BEEE1EB